MSGDVLSLRRVRNLHCLTNSEKQDLCRQSPQTAFDLSSTRCLQYFPSRMQHRVDAQQGGVVPETESFLNERCV